MHYHLHPDWNRYSVYLGATIFILIMAWLAVGRRVKPLVGQTYFTSSRFIPLFFSVFALGPALIFLLAAIDFLFFETDANIGGHWIRLFSSVFLTLFGLFCGFGVKLFGTQALWPNRLTVDASGVRGRIGGRTRQWAWNEIQDVNIGFGKPDVADVLLSLRHDDPFLVRHFQRLHWLPWAKQANVRQVSLGCQWKPVTITISGQQAVYRAIREGLNRYRTSQSDVATPPTYAQPITAQLSG